MAGAVVELSSGLWRGMWRERRWGVGGCEVLAGEDVGFEGCEADVAEHAGLEHNS